ncbi:MAG: hypothetical protein WA156_09925, partial [Methylocystis silviterrae]
RALNSPAIHLPYCLEKVDGEKYVVLNRDYKPIGFKTDNFVTYNDYPIAISIKSLTPAVAAKISWEGSSSIERIYLYNDASVPILNATNMTNYIERLKVLAKLKVA